jgi:hypothetical protein
MQNTVLSKRQLTGQHILVDSHALLSQVIEPPCNFSKIEAHGSMEEAKAIEFRLFNCTK